MALTIIIAFLSLIGLVVLHEFGHFIIAKKFGVKVEEFGIGYPPRLFGKKFGETFYSLNLIPFGAFVKLYGEEGGLEDSRSFVGLPMWQRFSIVLGGVVSFWIIAIFIFSIVFIIGVEIPVADDTSYNLTNPQVKVTQVTLNSPAAIAGVRPGDVIKNITIGSQQLQVTKVKEVQEITEDYGGKEITLIIQRGEETFKIPIVPRVSPPEGQGPLGIGLVRIATLIKNYPWYQAPIQGAQYCGELTLKTIQGLFMMIENIIQGKGMPSGTEPSGPLGIFVFLATAAEIGISFFLYFIAIIAALLAFFNILPIPALDGGKLLFLTIEKIRKRPVSQRIEQNVTAVFFSLLIFLLILITIKYDIPRISEFIKSRF